MNKIKLGDVEEFEIFAVQKGFDTEFEITENEGGTSHYDNLVDLASDIFICDGQIGYHRLKAIAKSCLAGKDPQLDEYEEEELLDK